MSRETWLWVDDDYSGIYRAGEARPRQTSLYVSAEKLRELVQLFEQWSEDNFSNMEGEDAVGFAKYEGCHIMAAACAERLAAIVAEEEA